MHSPSKRENKQLCFSFRDKVKGINQLISRSHSNLEDRPSQCFECSDYSFFAVTVTRDKGIYDVGRSAKIKLIEEVVPSQHFLLLLVSDRSQRTGAPRVSKNNDH